MARYITFEYDQDPDYSWLEGHEGPIYRTRADAKANRNPLPQDWYNDPANHTSLQMLVRKQGKCGYDDVIDVMGGIDFISDWDDWTIGTFYYVNDIPKRCKYLRQLARDAGLRYRPRRRL